MTPAARSAMLRFTPTACTAVWRVAVRACTSQPGQKPSKDAVLSLATLPTSLSSLDLKYLEHDALRAKFDMYDKNGDGMIDASEATQLLLDAGVAEPTRDQAQAVIDSLDAFQDGKVHWEEFKAAVDKAAAPVDKRVRPISAALLLYAGGLGVQIPVLPMFMKSLGLANAEMGFVQSSHSLAKLLSNLPAAKLVERVGRRPMLVGGTALEALAMAGMGASTTALEMTCCMALAGVGGTSMMTGANMYLSDISTPANRARTFMPLQVTALAGISLGPPLGGFLAGAYGIHAPYYVISAMLASSSVTIWATCPETLGQQSGGAAAAGVTGATADGPTLLTQWREIGSVRELQGLFASSFAQGARDGGMPVVAMLYMYDTLGMSTQQVGFYMMSAVGAMAVCVGPAAVLSDRYADRRQVLMLPAFAGPFLCLGAQSLSASTSHPIIAFFGLGMVGASISAIQMATVTPFMISHVSEQQRAQAIAINTTMNDVGRVAGAVSLGVLGGVAGVPAAMQANALVGLAAAGFFALRTRAPRAALK